MGLSDNPAASTNSDEETCSATTTSTPYTSKEEEEDDDVDDGDDSNSYYTIDYGRDEEESAGPFVPSIEIKRLMEGSILINTVALKDVALTSALFQVLEEEKLDIVFENHHRSDSTVSHTIQVRVQPEYNMDGLARKLCIWAGKHT